MVELLTDKQVYQSGRLVPCRLTGEALEAARRDTMAWRILAAHNTAGDGQALKIKFDAMASHDITYVGIVQTARASGMQAFPLPYVLTNCHNSLCAVGGTINEDDHVFGLSAAKKYGGIFVPAHQSVIHSYMREEMSVCGRMILGSDSHTRYGALGTMGVGEGGPELVKQLLGRTYDVARPDVVAIYLKGKPRPGVGPQDVALALIRAVFASGFVKNKVMEFVGPGIANLSVEYRNGIDVMTTETTCLSSIWMTDEKVADYYAVHGRPEDYAPLAPGEGACYDGAVVVDLDQIPSMIALPFHPSNAYPIATFLENAQDLLHACEREAQHISGKVAPRLADKVHGREVYVDQGVIAGCSGGIYDNLVAAADILRGHTIGDGAFNLSVYPASQPVMMQLLKDGLAAELIAAGAVLRTAFCGPCFGAGDVPSNNGLSIRHTTRNFPNREGSKPADGQISYVALMDARSIAATAANGGRITAADALDLPEEAPIAYAYDRSAYAHRVYQGFGKPQPEQELVFGPNIADWPQMAALPENLLLTVAAAIYDPVTTTDELIPSGDTSSYRSNPIKLAQFTLSRKDPAYVGRAQAADQLEQARRRGDADQVAAEYALIGRDAAEAMSDTGLGSVVFALKPGDGSAREQAASCQRVLGGCANIAGEYATKRYRSNVVNWGMIPFTMDQADQADIKPMDRIYIPGIRAALVSGAPEVAAQIIRDGKARPISLKLTAITPDERDIILAGSLINYYAAQR
ncbi:MAG: hydratase [Christensenellales bacterium]|jgi:aconitate hydratase